MTRHAVRTRLGTLAIALLAPALLVAVERPVGACSLAGNQMHYVDAAFATDTVAPSAVTADVTVSRHYDDEENVGCGKIASCGSYGLISLDVTATDNAAPADQLGYEITVVTGRMPRDLNLMEVPARGPELYLYFSATDRAPFALTLEVRAVDLNGNLGPATLVEIDDPGDPEDGGGCTTTTVPAAPPIAFALGALLVALRRRRPATV
jgi:uncharacterized protein (TIGR03382 family)